MAKTYLQLVNAVLVELREPEVATVTESDYSTLVAAYVNTAKRAVENAWKWSMLYTTFTLTTAAADDTYSLTGTDERAEIDDVWNHTTNAQMGRTTRPQMHAYAAQTGGPSTGSPCEFIEAGLDGSGQVQVQLYPVPDAIETVKVYGWAPQADLSADSDTLTVPHRPVVETALALCRGERGEDGGIQVSEAGQWAARAASDAIAIDANKHPEDTRWEAV